MKYLQHNTRPTGGSIVKFFVKTAKAEHLSVVTYDRNPFIFFGPLGMRFHVHTKNKNGMHAAVASEPCNKRFSIGAGCNHPVTAAIFRGNSNPRRIHLISNVAPQRGITTKVLGELKVFC